MYRRLQAAGVAHNDVGARHILTRQEKIIDQTDAENEEFVNSLTLCIIDFDGAMSA
jgi:hypothetical protein